MTVGLIGAGLLGSAMAQRWLAAGFRVAGFDVDARQSAALEAMGATALPSAAAVAQAASVIVLSLPDSRISGEVLAALRQQLLLAGKLVIDTSTGEPGEMESWGRQGFRYLDATVAGSSQQVRQGEVTVMAGGSPSDFTAARPVLEAFANRLFHVGPCGAGAQMKLIVNLALGLNRAVLAEALAFAGACGVDPALALDVLRNGPAWSRAMDTKGARMLAREWSPPEARLSQHHKDVRLILAEAARHGAELPLTELHDRLLDRAEAAGLGALDNSSILEIYPRKGVPSSK